MHTHLYYVVCSPYEYGHGGSALASVHRFGDMYIRRKKYSLNTVIHNLQFTRLENGETLQTTKFASKYMSIDF